MTYLLYVDFLGFRNLIKTGGHRVDRLYKIVDSLNAHRHHAFRTVAFSDTVLAYNIEDPATQHDHRYLVMYLCEFAKDLLYRLVGHNLYFRALLTYGEFQRYHLEHIDCFYGEALVSAHDLEKSIDCHGLFLDQHCHRLNNIFPVTTHTTGVYFVYLNQSIDGFLREWGVPGSLPITDPGFSNSDTPHFIAKDVLFLREVNRSMRHSLDPKVRAKHLCAWEYYRRRYPKFLQYLEANEFALKSISSTHQWPVEDDIREI